MTQNFNGKITQSTQNTPNFARKGIYIMRGIEDNRRWYE